MDHTSKAIDRPKIANLRQRPPLGDEMHTPAMREKTSARHIFKLLENATRRVDSARGNAQKVLAAIQTKLAGPPLCKDATTALLHGEIRNALRAMPEQKRAEAIAAAMERNDQDVLAAYLHGNPLLTGASPTEKEMRRHSWAQKHHADDLDRKARIEGAMKHMDNAASLLIDYVDSLTNQNEIAASVEAARKADEAVRRAAP
jgi:hypothetical protein